MWARDVPPLWSDPLGTPPQSSLLVYLPNIHNKRHKHTLIFSYTAAHQFSSLLSNPLYLMIILWPYSTGLSLGLKTSPTVFHIAHFLYSCARYAFMFNTTTIIKAADLSCSSGLHRTLYTVLCRSSELKTARTLRDFFIGLRGGECYEFKQSI